MGDGYHAHHGSDVKTLWRRQNTNLSAQDRWGGGVAGQITIRFRRVFPQRTGQAGSHHFRRQIHSPPQVTKVSTCPYGHIPVTPCTVHSCAGMDIPAVHNTGLLPDPVQGDRLRYIC